MRRIAVRYVREGGLWWADSVNVPGLSVTADSIGELRLQVQRAVAFALDDAPFELVEVDSVGGHRRTA